MLLCAACAEPKYQCIEQSQSFVCLFVCFLLEPEGTFIRKGVTLHSVLLSEGERERARERRGQ